MWHRFDFRLAQECFQLALRYDSSVPEALAGLAFCLSVGTGEPVRTGELEEAERLAEEVLAGPSAHYEAYLVLANVSDSRHQPVMMRDYYMKAYKLEPERPEAYLLVACSAAGAGHVSRAFSDLKNAAALDGSLGAACFFFQGCAYLNAGDYAHAGAQFRKCCQLDPGHDTARSRLALCLLMTGDVRGAYAEAQSSMMRSPHLPENRLVLAVCHAQLGDMATAERYFEEAEDMLPDMADVIRELRESVRAYAPKVVVLQLSDQLVPQTVGGSLVGYDLRCFARIKNITNESRSCTVDFEYYDQYGRLLLTQTEYVGRIGPGVTRVVQDTVYDEDTISGISYYRAVVSE